MSHVCDVGDERVDAENSVNLHERDEVSRRGKVASELFAVASFMAHPVCGYVIFPIDQRSFTLDM